MSEWNAMTYEGKDTILRVVREETEGMLALASPPDNWDVATPCEGWTTADVVGHIVDTTEGYFKAFDAAQGKGSVPDAHGLLVMSELANAGAKAFSGLPQEQMVERLRPAYTSKQRMHTTKRKASRKKQKAHKEKCC